MFVSITYWDTFNEKRGAKPVHKDIHNVIEVYRFYGHYTDNDYLKIITKDNKELIIEWDQITSLIIMQD